MNQAVKTILFLSSSSGPGGAERVLSKLATSLNNQRYRPIVGLFRPGWLQDECERSGISTYLLPSPGSFDPVWVWKCLKLIRKERVALIHSHEFDANVHGAMVARLAGIPQVATVHGKNYYWEKARRRIAYRLLSRWAIMVAVSEDLKGFVASRVGISVKRVTTVYNGVEIHPEVDRSVVEELRGQLGISRDTQIIGTVGSLYPVKGHKFLLEALPIVFRERPRTVVLIVGRGELEASLKAEVKRLGQEQRVRFLGLRQDVPQLLALLDVFVMPSLSEGLSIALLEAMVARKPVVVTNVGGNPEIVRDKETGFLVPPQDSIGLAQGLLSLLSDAEQARQFGEAGRHRVETKFSLSMMVNSYQALYEQYLPVPSGGVA